MFIIFYKTLKRRVYAQKDFKNFPRKHPKQRYSITGVSLEYLEYSWEGVLLWGFLGNLPKTSWTAIPESKFDRIIALGDWYS